MHDSLLRQVRRVVFLASGAVAASSPAWATVFPVTQTREVTTFAFLDWMSGEEPLRSSESVVSTEQGPYTESAVCLLQVGDSEVRAVADQTSSMAPDFIEGRIVFSAEASIVEPARAALGITSTSVLYDFDVDVPTECHFVAQVEAVDFAVIDISLRVRNGAMILVRQFFQTDELFDETVSLAPGSYSLALGGGGDAAMSPKGSGSSFGTMDFMVTFLIPASVPAAPGGSDGAIVLAPNPIHDRTTVFLRGPSVGNGPVVVMDASGRLLRSLGPAMGSALHWDTRDDDGHLVPAGVYFVRGNGAIARATVLR